MPKFESVTSLGVQNRLESLNANKAGGPDSVPTYILRELSHELAPILGSLFQVTRSGSVAK